MYTLLAILIAIASLLLIGAVLIQKSKGGGLAQGMADYNRFGGVRKTTEFIEKATWGLAIFICVLSIATAYIGSGVSVDNGPQVTELNVGDSQAPAYENNAAPAAESKAAPAAESKAAPAAEQAPAAPAPQQAPAPAPAK